MGQGGRADNQVRGAGKLKLLTFAVSLLPLVILLIALNGDIPDPDRSAHDMWAGQLAKTGSLTISENGETSDWRLYYPNTVPKPFELLIGFIRLPGDRLLNALTALVLGAMAIAAVRFASGDAGAAAGLFLGFNPVFIVLCLRGNPAIPFLGAMFLAQTARGETAGAVLASLARPEGFIYGGWEGLRHRNWKMLAIMLLTGAVWLYFHRAACGSFLWASREVRYSVAAMAYPTPNTLNLFPWAFLRSILILGAPGAAILYAGFRRWELAVPFSINFVLLGISLALGSLVLPRYVDQLFLLSIPFIFRETQRMLRGKALKLATAAILLFPAFQWIATIPEILEHRKLREFYTAVDLPEQGVLAANELLIPGLALANGINDPRSGFVSLDRAAWEGAAEEDLLEHGVVKVVVLPMGLYFPRHTEEWTESLNELEVEHYGN